MKLYQRTFVNPLLAIAFKDGVDFVGDPDYRAMEPKHEGQHWTVLVEHDDGEDDEDVGIVRKNVADRFYAAKDAAKMSSQTESKKWFEPSEPKTKLRLETLGDYQKHLDKMKPRVVGQPATMAEVIHAPVKISHNSNDDDDDIEACGECTHCATGHDCIRVINNALGVISF